MLTNVKQNLLKLWWCNKTKGAVELMCNFSLYTRNKMSPNTTLRATTPKDFSGCLTGMWDALNFDICHGWIKRWKLKPWNNRPHPYAKRKSCAILQTMNSFIWYTVSENYYVWMTLFEWYDNSSTRVSYKSCCKHAADVFYLKLLPKPRYFQHDWLLTTRMDRARTAHSTNVATPLRNDEASSWGRVEGVAISEPP